MPDDDKSHVFRGQYTAIKNMTESEITQRLSREHASYEEIQIVLSFHYDLEKEKHLKKLKGWTYKYNPFVEMLIERRASSARIRELTDMSIGSLLASSESILLLAYAWFGIGCYGLAEECFHTSLSLAFLTNHVDGALVAASYLGTLYLASEDYAHAYKISTQALEAAPNIRDFIGFTTRLHTIILLSLFMSNHKETASVYARKNKITKLNDVVAETMTDVYSFLAEKEKAKLVKTTCKKIQELL